MKRIIHYFPIAFVGTLLLASLVSSCALSVLGDEYTKCPIDGGNGYWYLWTNQNLNFVEAAKLCSDNNLSLVTKDTAVLIANSTQECAFNKNWTTWTETQVPDNQAEFYFVTRNENNLPIPEDIPADSEEKTKPDVICVSR